MTRLIESDVRILASHLDQVEENLRAATGLGYLGIAARASGIGEGVARDALADTAIAIVPITSGQGVIPGFTECVADICTHVGARAAVTTQSDVAGWAEALAGGAHLVFAADDFRFLAVNSKRGWSADNDRCTAEAYVAALDAAAGGVEDKPVLVLGLGPVGRAAAARLTELGARVHVCEPDAARLAAAWEALPHLEPVDLKTGLSDCWLVLDATPVADLIDHDWVWPEAIVSAPGLPPAVTRAARKALGPRLIHEPLVLGTVTMAVRALVAPFD